MLLCRQCYRFHLIVRQHHWLEDSSDTDFSGSVSAELTLTGGSVSASANHMESEREGW
jgi:hypothetical protein